MVKRLFLMFFLLLLAFVGGYLVSLSNQPKVEIIPQKINKAIISTTRVISGNVTDKATGNKALTVENSGDKYTLNVSGEFFVTKIQPIAPGEATPSSGSSKIPLLENKPQKPVDNFELIKVGDHVTVNLEELPDGDFVIKNIVIF